MKLSETISIRANASAVWPYLRDPELWPGFMAKIAAAEQISENLYHIEISGKTVIGSIDDMVDLHRVRFVGVVEDRPAKKPFAVEYRLEGHETSLTVTETQDLPLPFPLGALAHVARLIGLNEEQTNLETLKELCESSQGDHSQKRG